MTNATKTLGILFVALAAISVLMELFGNRSASQAFTTEIISADTSQVNAIDIIRPTADDTIQLTSKGGQWKVQSGGSSFPADGQAVRNALSQLSDINVNALVTRDKEDYTRYKVDSTGTKLVLKRNSQMLDQIYIGAPQRAGRRQFNTYVRPADRTEVYSVEGFLRPTFNKSLSDWRDKTVWDISSSKIARVNFMFPADSSYSIKRVGQNKYVSNGDSLNSSEVRSILNQLGGLEASGFVTNVSKENFGTEKYAVQLKLKSGEQRRLRIKDHPTKSSQYQVVASDYPYVFTLNRSTWDDQVFKPRKSLLK